MSIKDIQTSSSYSTRKNKKIRDFRNDQIDVESSFFHIFFNVYVVQNRVLRLSRKLFRETYSIKEKTFEPSFEYQSVKLTAELHLTRKEFVFNLEKLKLKKKLLYHNISKTLFISNPIPKFVKTPQQIFFYFQFIKDF